MGLFSKDIKTMDDLFMHTLQDIYYAEKQILNSLPEMIEKTTDRELATGLKKHLGETEQQLAALRASGRYQDSDHVVRICWMTESQAKARGWT